MDRADIRWTTVHIEKSVQNYNLLKSADDMNRHRVRREQWHDQRNRPPDSLSGRCPR